METVFLSVLCFLAGMITSIIILIWVCKRRLSPIRLAAQGLTIEESVTLMWGFLLILHGKSIDELLKISPMFREANQLLGEVRSLKRNIQNISGDKNGQADSPADPGSY